MVSEKISFIFGRAGSGKSRMLREEIRRVIGRGEAAYFIVPEQYTHEAERELGEALGGGLIGNAQVLSFASLARKVLKETGDRRVFLSAQGRRMVIRKVATENAAHFKAFGSVHDKKGFAEKLDELFVMCRRYNVSPDMLKAAAEAMPEETLLNYKLNDIAVINAKAQAYLDSRYLYSEAALDALIEKLPASSLKGSYVYIDGLDVPTAQTYSIIGALMQTCREITVSIRADDDVNSRDRELFAPEMQVYEKLYAMAKAKGVKIEARHLPIENAAWCGQRHASSAIAHLERELFAYPFNVFKAPQSDITIFTASNRAAEVNAAATQVQSLVHSGMRYRDIAIIASDLDAYSPIVKRVFLERGIPLFMDARHSLQGHPAVELVIAALRCASRGYRRADVLRLIKSGLCGLTTDETELLENYMLSYGIQGSSLKKPFEKGDVPEAAERARQTIMEPLLQLQSELNGGDVAQKTVALYNYVERLDVRSGLKRIVERLKSEGKYELMEESAQVWNILMELFTQLHAIMGDALLSTSRYIEILEEGIDSYSVGVIPATAAQVVLGDVSRTRNRSIKALLVLGCNEGLLPREHKDDGIIADSELKQLEGMGLGVWGDTFIKSQYERLDIYSALTKPSQKLWLGYSLNADGSELSESSLIDRIRLLFPEITQCSDIDAPDYGFDPVASGAGNLKPLVIGLREFMDKGARNPVCAGLYNWYCSKPEYAGLIRDITDTLFDDGSLPPFGRKLAQMLYGRHMVSGITRLETFNSCPFKHFMQYGIKARERREYRESPVDAGSFYHEVLEAFAKKIAEEGIEWQALDHEACSELIDEVLPPIIAAHNDGKLLESPRAVAECMRMVRRVKLTAWAMAQQLATGGFSPYASEFRFGPGEMLPPIVIELEDGTRAALSGKIDRVDAYNDYLRVVDYKSGNDGFKYERLYEGIQLQLPLYLAAALALSENSKPAGMYYLPVKEPDIDSAVDEAKFEQELLKKFKLSGITLDDIKILNAAGPKGLVIDSKLVNRAELDAAMEYAMQKATATLAEILKGDYSPSPVKSGQYSACRSCSYISVCGFDARLPGCRYRNVRSMDAEKFFEKAAPEATHEVDG